MICSAARPCRRPGGENQMRVRIWDPATAPATSSPDAPRWLGDPGAIDPAVVGAKAANLAIARRRHLPVVDGFVVPVPVVDAHPGSPPDEVRSAWAELSAGEIGSAHV